MTEIEIPEWAKIANGKRFIKCPKCENGWCNEIDNKMKCLRCNFTTYTTKLEGFWIKNKKKALRKAILAEKGFTETESYFCTLCRVSHIAGSAIGFKHLKHIGKHEKLRICSVPMCNEPLTGRQKKFGCNKNCNKYYNWAHTCVDCGYNFAFKGDGYTTTRTCFKCSSKNKGAVIEDWEVFDLSPTVKWPEVVARLRQLRNTNSLNNRHKEAFIRLSAFYTEKAKDKSPFN